MAATYSININTPQEAVSYTSITSILNLLPDNTQKLISPRDARDAVFSAWENSVFRYTTIGAYEYIGLNREDIKTKIYFGKKQLNKQDLMTHVLLSNTDTDIYFYNTKLDTNPSQDLKISFLGGNDTTLHTLAPYLEVKKLTGTSSNYLTMNLVNPGLAGSDINISSSFGRINLQNQLTIPTESEILDLINSPVESNNDDLFLVRNSTGFIELKKVKIDYAYIGSTSSVTNIYGDQVLVNGFPLDFTESTPTVISVGGIKPGMTFDSVPLTEMIRMILYPDLGPLVDINLSLNVIERNHTANTVIAYDYTITKRTHDVASTTISIISNTVNAFPGQVVTGSGLITQNFPSTYTFSGPFIQSSPNVFTFSVNSIDSTGTSSATASDVLNFVYPYFYGSSNTLAPPNFQNVINNDLNQRVDVYQNQNLLVYADNEYIYFGYPAIYGTLSMIIDGNGFTSYDAGDPAPSWTYSTISVNSKNPGYWDGISYLVYRTIDKVSTMYTQEYKFNFN